MTGRKLSDDIIERIFVLKVRDQLPYSVIAERLNLSIDTVQKYINEFRKAGRLVSPQSHRSAPDPAR